MPVELKGSCHCGAVAFTVQSSTPVPYQLCVCSICRKVGGTGGSVNLGAHAHTLQITKGKADISCVILSRRSYMSLTVKRGNRIYKAVLSGRGTPEERRGSAERHFCSKCSAMLWWWDENRCAANPRLSTYPTHTNFYLTCRPEYLHPFASAIDEPDLKAPEEMVSSGPDLFT